ncbi:MAG TPA: gluconokinase, GntK/IdnK-type, partial [Salinimicrobium sp.]|nr:gluconokinase, GntK/IdnK-type [Salinimicrobium sp.]
MKVYIVMGVSGVGKSTIGKSLSEELQIPFYDADDFHPEKNISKMKSGQSLNDEDRQVWLQILSGEIKSWNKGEGAILACSALRESYRKQLQVIPENELNWIFLYSDYEIILDRLGARKGHYFKSDLLKSQYEILEYPEYGIHINVNTSKENIIKKIMRALSGNPQPKIGILGLGVMGKSLALNLASKDIQVAVFNREVEGKEEDIAKNFSEEHENKYKFLWFNDLQEFVASLEPPRIILLMVNAGKAVDAVIENLLPFLDENDLVIDGGNSHYKDTTRRAKLLKKKEILFMGLGVSGGEEGALKGPSLMPGGAVETCQRAGALLEKIA